MAQNKRKSLAIDWLTFGMAYEQERGSLTVYEEIACLDRETGEVLWYYEDDEDAEMGAGLSEEENREVRERVEAEPDRYLEIPPLDHGDHHDMLRAFLRSNWTDDEALWRRTYELYDGSIGRWKRAVGDQKIVHAYHDFCERRTQELAEDFLRDHGIEPKWT